MSRSAKRKKHRSDRYMKAVKPRWHEKNGPVDVVASREFYAVFILVGLAKKKGRPKHNSKEQVSEKTVIIVFNNVSMRNSDSNTRG